MNVFENIKVSESALQEISDIKDKAQELYQMMNHLQTNREMQLAKTNLEQAVMWYVKGVALNDKRMREADEAIDALISEIKPE